MAPFATFREISASVEQVFAAISDPQRLARWWGPAGFTNAFSVCEFKNGGRWSFVMRGPTGQNFSNESVFETVEAPNRVVIQHVSQPRYRLTITLSSSEKGTLVSWYQAFESSKVAEGVKHVVVPANEENLDRLSAEVLSR